MEEGGADVRIVTEPTRKPTTWLSAQAGPRRRIRESGVLLSGGASPCNAEIPADGRGDAPAPDVRSLHSGEGIHMARYHVSSRDPKRLWKTAGSYTLCAMQP